MIWKLSPFAESVNTFWKKNPRAISLAYWNERPYDRAMMTIADILDKAGGAGAVAEALAAGDDPSLVRTYWAVVKWRKIGVPRSHYDIIAQLAKVSVAEVHAANRAIDRARSRPSGSPLPSAA